MTDHLFCFDENLPEKRSTRFGLEDVGAKINTAVSWPFEPNFCNTAKRNVITKSKSHYSLYTIKLTKVIKSKFFKTDCGKSSVDLL